MCVAAIIIVASCFVTGCQEEDSLDSLDVFLDLDMISLSKRNLTEHEMIIFQKSQELINANAKYKNGKFILNIKQGAEIGMSDRLFDFFQESIININQQIEGMELVEVAPNRFQNAGDVDKHIPRLKNGGIESGSNSASSTSFSYGIGFYSRTVSLNHSDAISLINSMQSGYSDIGYWGTIITGCMGNKIGTAIVGLHSYLKSLEWGRIETKYLQSQQKGITITETTYTSSIIPYTFHVVQY
jgi:hypothetical protein